jgi:hypothetical protein
VGEIVTVEGEVVTAETTDDTCVLEFAPGDPVAFRAVLLRPLLSTGPRHPDRLYRGRQVRATGRVQQFQGRPEMVLRSTDQIQVTDDDGATFTAAEPEVQPATPAPHPPAARPADATAAQAIAPAPPAGLPTTSASQAVPPTPSPAASAAPPVAPAPSPAPPPARGLVEAVQQKMASLTPCERARARWRDAAAVAGARAAALGRCLDAASYDCRAERRLLGPALSALGVSEDEIADACR